MRIMIFITLLCSFCSAQNNIEAVKERIANEARRQFSNAGIDSLVIEFRGVFPQKEIPPEAIFSHQFTKGNNSVAVEYADERGSAHRSVISLRLRTFQNVLLASERIAKHQTLSETKFRREMVETTLLNNPLVFGCTMENFRSTRMITEGAMITQTHIQKIPPVLQNEKIKIMSRVANIQVSTFGRAISDGNFGEKIIVQPEGTHERILATVIAKGLAEVE